MVLKKILLRSNLPEHLATEIMYEIAAARADGAELIRIETSTSEDGASVYKKLYSSLIRLLKGMKDDGRIQFFATKDNFDSLSTEAVFLQNKYPTHFESISSEDGKDYLYIKL